MISFKKQFEFGTKAETLQRLRPLLQKSSIPDLMSFTVDMWNNGSKAQLLNEIKNKFSQSKIIVRSSTAVEDSDVTAKAGAFLSVPDISPQDGGELERVVAEVISSYYKEEETISGEETANEVIVQEMIQDVLISGVLFTQDMNTGAPYYVINYDDKSGSTDTVTSGTGYHNRTLYVFRDTWDQISSTRFKKILEAVREIETLLDNISLDIEFALSSDHQVHIFQVRRITTHPHWNRGHSLSIKDSVDRMREALCERYTINTDTPQGEIENTILGNMPDWNPAEMIGTTPRPLAFSLYRKLITDYAWRKARRLMGYREAKGMPLMVSLAGQPYIDVRQSFLSFTPASLDDSIAEKLTHAWLERLRNNHHLHDKIEFEVAITIFTPDFDNHVQSLIPEVLDQNELRAFKDSLLELTNNILTGRHTAINRQFGFINDLSKRRKMFIDNCHKPDTNTIAALLEDVIEYGTIPFSILARHGFIAKSFLKSFVAMGIFSQEEIDSFTRTIPTVATEFIEDIRQYVSGSLSQDDFLEKYGHLRPGTYDILSLRYDYRLNALSSLPVSGEKEKLPPDFVLSEEKGKEIDNLLKSQGINTTAEKLFNYIKKAVQGREYAKFVFTHNISDALEIIAAWGEQYGLTREELSYCSINDILDSGIEPKGRSVESYLRNLSEKGKYHHDVTNSVRLPFLITRLSDLVIIPLAVEEPNYVTRKNVRGKVVLISGTDLDPSLIDNAIVAIESADPGFDWIFTRPIIGLVTRFGGANSHMAIRCAEFGLPAAIGCGEQIFEKVVTSGFIDLNCAERNITVLQNTVYV